MKAKGEVKTWMNAGSGKVDQVQSDPTLFSAGTDEEGNWCIFTESGWEITTRIEELE